ncbi:MAG: hypothetical protein EB069_02850 [Actinobacteria bacterium]|jgi:hypothetical protein|nr:hypothetical protein [Actinomycetota bacterium]
MKLSSAKVSNAVPPFFFELAGSFIALIENFQHRRFKLDDFLTTNYQIRSIQDVRKATDLECQIES